MGGRLMRTSGNFKIAFVLPVYWPAVGGCELHTHELVKRLSEQHNITVTTLINNQEDKLSHELWVACILKAPSHPVTYNDNRAEVKRLSLNFFEKSTNLPLARAQSPKLPMIMNTFAMERLSDFYLKKLLPEIKGADMVHCVHGGVSYLGYAAYKAAQGLNIPFVYTPVLHLLRRDGAEPELHICPRGWTDSYWQHLCFSADAVICMTDFERDYYQKWGIPSQRLFRVGVGPLVSAEKDGRILDKHGLKGKKMVLFLGRNVKYKGIEALLQAAPMVWKIFPDTFFVFAGPKEGDIGQIYGRYRDERIKTLGFITDEEKSALLDACDIFCMPSMEESLGGTYLEAWTFGKPIIGARIPPLIELNAGNEGGFLIDVKPEEIGDAIIRLREDPLMANNMGKWGKERAEKIYSWDVITKKMEDIYHAVLKSNNQLKMKEKNVNE